MGIVYVLTNEAMPGLIKIGLTDAAVEQRMLSLDNTSVPVPFECYYAAEVADAAAVEKALHTALGDHRVRKSREFFQLDAFRAKAFLELLAVNDVTPRDEVFESPDDEEAIQRVQSKRPQFRFSAAGIPAGSVLTFVRNPEETAVVIDDRKILFRGDEHSLTSAAEILMRELGYRWSTLQGTKFWLFEDQTLVERRDEIEASIIAED